MNNPLISIIVPVYRVPEIFLRQCIESCINQTNSNYELIMVDDGSPDRCGEICDSYAKKHSQIKVIHKENGGLVSSRNAGYKAASGEWITFVDGDDWISPDMINDLQKEIANYEGKCINVFFWCTVQELPNASIKYGKWDWNLYEDHKMYENTDCKWLAANVLDYKAGVASATAKLYRKSWCIKNNIYHNPKLRQGAEAYDFNMRSFYFSKRCVFLCKFFYHYRFNNESISKKVNIENTKYIIQCLDTISDFIKSTDNPGYFKEAFDRRIAFLMVTMAMNTYFSPENKMPLSDKIKYFKRDIYTNSYFKNNLITFKSKKLDKLRRIAYLCIKYRLFCCIELIARAKEIAIKMGYFNY
jgi:glycosyltransferase involved in cell wall biosynthesis